MFEFSRNSITIFGFAVHYYGILIALGALLGVLLAIKREKKLGLPKDTVLDLAIICIPIAIICARIYYVIFEWEFYSKDLSAIFDMRGGGLAIYGGIIGGLLSGYIIARRKKIGFSVLADLTAPSIALGQAIGRWGNFFNQEAYGIAVNNPTHMFFPLSVFIERDGLWHYATFFYESVWCLLVTAALLVASKKQLFKRNGDCMLWYAFLYALERSAVEGLRTDSLYLGPVRISQALSLAVILFAAVMFALRRGAPAWLRIIAPAACLALLILIGIGIIPSVSWPAAFLCLAALLLTGALYLKTPAKAAP